MHCADYGCSSLRDSPLGTIWHHQFQNQIRIAGAVTSFYGFDRNIGFIMVVTGGSTTSTSFTSSILLWSTMIGIHPVRCKRRSVLKLDVWQLLCCNTTSLVFRHGNAKINGRPFLGFWTTEVKAANYVIEEERNIMSLRDTCIVKVAFYIRDYFRNAPLTH